MKKENLTAIFGALLVFAVGSLLTFSLRSDDQYSRVENVVYYHNPNTGKLGLYLSFGLEPNHKYLFQFTRDGVNFFDAFIEDTTGRSVETYESFNIPDPCNAIWPRIQDLGPTK